MLVGDEALTRPLTRFAATSSGSAIAFHDFPLKCRAYASPTVESKAKAHVLLGPVVTIPLITIVSTLDENVAVAQPFGVSAATFGEPPRAAHTFVGDVALNSLT